MKESTKKIIRAHGWRLDRALHYYIYFAYYNLYVRVLVAAFDGLAWVLARLEPGGRAYRGLDWMQDKAAGFVFARYHGKVLSRGDVTKIIRLEESIELGPDTTRRIVPFKYARDIVLREPEHLAVMECPCKALMDEPCQPSASCIAVGRPVVDFWLEHCQKNKVRRITKEEALDIIHRLRKTGHYNQAFFKVATGGRMGVICNCCSKCCGGGMGPRFTRDFYKKHREAIEQALGGRGDLTKAVGLLAPSGYTVRHDPLKCVLCGQCRDICNFGAIEIREGERLYDQVSCVGCELCVEHCRNGALCLVHEDRGGFMPLDLDLAREKLG
ncbi:MAG: 4Fe-4S binding protein [bacterium]